jgi:hypothetical protein
MSAYRHANNTVSAHGATAVTPSDATVLPVCRALYVGTTGNITVRMADGQDNILFTAVAVGIFPIQVDKVYSTGTTAGAIVAMY